MAAELLRPVGSVVHRADFPPPPALVPRAQRGRSGNRRNAGIIMPTKHLIPVRREGSGAGAAPPPPRRFLPRFLKAEDQNHLISVPSSKAGVAPPPSGALLSSAVLPRSLLQNKNPTFQVAFIGSFGPKRRHPRVFIAAQGSACFSSRAFPGASPGFQLQLLNN